MITQCCLVFSLLVLAISSNLTNAEDLPPYVVSIHYNWMHQCTGTLISKYEVVTAASCVCKNNLAADPQKLAVHAGSNIEKPTRIMSIASIDCHKQFTDHQTYGLSHDIAVIKLKDEAKIEKADLPESPKGYASKGPCKIHLWKKRQLTTVDGIRLTTNESCEKKFLRDESLDEEHICSLTPQYEIYDVDKGTPLICDKKFVGLLNWQYLYMGQPVRPHIYVNLMKYAGYFDVIGKYAV